MVKTKKVPKRFGNIAMEKGFITTYQFVEAMNIQKGEDAGAGKHRLIGAILLSEGYMTRAQIDEVLETMDTKHGFGHIWSLLFRTH